MELEFLENIQVELKFHELEFQIFFFPKSKFAITRLSKNRVLHRKPEGFSLVENSISFGNFENILRI